MNSNNLENHQSKSSINKSNSTFLFFPIDPPLSRCIILHAIGEYGLFLKNSGYGLVKIESDGLRYGI